MINAPGASPSIFAYCKLSKATIINSSTEITLLLHGFLPYSYWNSGSNSDWDSGNGGDDETFQRYLFPVTFLVLSFRCSKRLRNNYFPSTGMWQAYVYPEQTYRKLPKIYPPFLHTTFRQKWRGGVGCSNTQFVSCIHPFLPFLVLNTHEFNNYDDCHGFLKEQQLRWTCAMGNQRHLCWY